MSATRNRAALDVQERRDVEVRRYFELPLTRNESPALGLSWTLHRVINEQSPLQGLTAEDLYVSDISLVVAAQTVHARKSYEHPEIRFGHRYLDVLGTTDEGRLRIDYGRFLDTFEGEALPGPTG